MKYLEGTGHYSLVMKSSGSHGLFDIIAIPARETQELFAYAVELIQVKSGMVYGKDLEQYINFAKRVGKSSCTEIWVVEKGKKITEGYILTVFADGTVSKREVQRKAVETSGEVRGPA